MKRIKWIVALASMVLVCSLPGVAGSSQLISDEPSPLAVNVAIREYVAENNRRISVTSMGNLIGFESPAGFEHINVKRPREGYVLAYQFLGSLKTLVAYDTFDTFSSNIKPGKRDFVPVSFVAPPSRVNIRFGEVITAVAVVETSDGRLRLTNKITWPAGSETVVTAMTIQNRSKGRLRLLTGKRHMDIDTDGGGLVGKAPPDANIVVGPSALTLNLNPFRTSASAFTLNILARPCFCPPPPPGPPVEPTDVVTITGSFATGATTATGSTSASGSPSATGAKPAIASISDVSNDQVWQSASVGQAFVGRMDQLRDTQQTLSWGFNLVLSRFQDVTVFSELAAR